MEANNVSKRNIIEDLLENQSKELEPKTHCCECSKGDHFDPRHLVHIQYPKCNCKNSRLKADAIEDGGYF